MSRVMDRAASAADARAAQRRDEIAQEASALPGISARIEDEDVVLEGRGLLERWIRDASIRYIGRQQI